MKCQNGGKLCGLELWGLNKWKRLGCFLLVVFGIPAHGFTATSSNSTNVFVDQCRMDCTLRKDFASCGKYRVVRWLHDVKEKEFSYGPVRLVRIPSMPYQTVLPKLPQSRVFKTGAIETLNFVRDIIEDVLTKRALVYTVDNVPTGRSFSMPMILDEDEFMQMKNKNKPEENVRLFKKKKSLILPILILLNLVKLKLMLLPIFLGVHFIKKLLVLASLVAPSILAHLKICKVPPHQQAHPYHTWATAAEAPADYPTGYGQEEPWVHRNDLPYHGYYGYGNPYG